MLIYRAFLTLTLLIILGTQFPSLAQTVDRFADYSQTGGKRPITAGVTSTTTVSQTIGGATVTVRIAGTGTLATIYSDRSLTPKSNPFTSDTTTGYFFFYADPSRRYDVEFTGGTSPNDLLAPVTWSDISIPSSTVTGSIPLIPTAGLLAEYRFDEGAGTTLTDYSGNGFNGTLVNSPTWSNGGLNFTRSSLQQVTLPGGLTPSVRSIVVFSTNALADSTGQRVAIVGNTGAIGLRILQNWDTKLQNVGVAGGAAFDASNTYGWDSIGGSEMLTTVLDAANDTQYIGPNALSGYIQRFGHFSGTYLVNQLTLGGDATYGYYQGRMYYALFYSTALTPAQIGAIYEAVKSRLRARGVDLSPQLNPTVTANQLAYVGDDLTAGGGGGTSYVPSVSLTDTFTSYNLGVLSKFALQLPYATRAVSTLYAPNAKRNVVLVQAGMNDYATLGRTTAQITADLRSITTQLKLQGWAPILVTMLSRTGQDANKNLLNATLRADWKDMGAVALADPAQLAVLGADGASANVTYFTDGIHLTGTAASLYAGVVSQAINALSAYPQDTAGLVTITSGATYNMSAEDRYLRIDPPGGSITVNLVSCAGQPGRRLEVKNIQSVGADTLTLDASGTETIDGSLTAIIPNLEGAVLVCDGNNWDRIARQSVPLNLLGSNSNLLYRIDSTNIGGVAGSAVTTLGEIDLNNTARTSGGSLPYFRLRTPADTGLTAGTPSIGIQLGGNNVGGSVTRTFTGPTTIASQWETQSTAPIYAGSTGMIISRAATHACTGGPVAGSNMTITQPLCFWDLGGKSAFGNLVGNADANEQSVITVDSSGTDGYPTSRISQHPTGSPSQLGLHIFGQTSAIGTRDVRYFLQPDTTSGFSIVGANNSGALILGTFGNANPIQFRVNNTVIGQANNGRLWYFGNGDVSATPQSARLSGTGASGTNTAGASLELAAGVGTGNAVQAPLCSRIPLTTSSGSSQQALSTNCYPFVLNMFTVEPGVNITSTTETDLFTTSSFGVSTIEAGMAKAGQTYMLDLSGRVSTTGTPTLTFRIKVGGVTISTLAPATLASGTSGTWRLTANLVIRAVGSSGTVSVNNAEAYFRNGSGAMQMMDASNASTVNLTVAADIRVTAQWGAASQSLDCDYARINLVTR